MTTDSKDVFMPSAASAYIRNVLCRAQIPLEPENHKTNWEDKPRTHKKYIRVQRLSASMVVFLLMT